MAGAILATAPLATAAEYEVEFQNTFGRMVQFTLDGSTPGGEVRAGVFNWTVLSSNSSEFHNFAPGAQVQTFCVEVTQFVGNEYDGANLTDMPQGKDPNQPDISPIRASLIGELYGRYRAFAMDESVSLNEQRDRVSAFALALWELTHEGTNADDSQLVSGDMLHVGTGNFQAFQLNGQSGGTSLANTWLASLEGGHGINPNLFGWTHSQYQDQIVFIPLPAPLALAAVGLVGMGVARRRLSRLLA
jgi:hypothetical protein